MAFGLVRLLETAGRVGVCDTVLAEALVGVALGLGCLGFDDPVREEDFGALEDELDELRPFLLLPADLAGTPSGPHTAGVFSFIGLEAGIEVWAVNHAHSTDH